MSARKKVNQSRPRAFARTTASRVAGAPCWAAAGDRKPVWARRPSRPPSNSNASADSPIPPAPQGNYAASVLTDCPAQSATPRLLRRPHRLKPDAGRRSRACLRVRVRKGGNFEKPPVSSTQIGIMKRRDFRRQPRVMWNFRVRGLLGAHGGARDSSFDPPGHASRRADPFARSRGQGHSPPCGPTGRRKPRLTRDPTPAQVLICARGSTRSP